MDRLLSSPVFIFSPVRSGSTLLRCVLGSHSCIHAPHELYLTDLTVQTWDGCRYALALLGMTIRDIEHLLWDLILHRELVRSGKQVFVYKTPDSVLSWRRIAECWPAAKYIFLVRHPVHIVASMARVYDDPIAIEGLRKFFADVVGEARAELLEPTARYEDLAIEEVLKSVHAIDEARAELPGPTVRYEDLTTRPAEVVSALCAFLGVPWEPEMLDYGRFDHGSLGDWSSENLRSGWIQPPRTMPAPDEVPEGLKAWCQSWGYLDPSMQPTSTA